MAVLDNSPGPKYSFENHISGQLFCWLIESDQLDYQAMIDESAHGGTDPQSWTERLARALKAKIGQDWQPQPRVSIPNPTDGTAPHPTAPAYNIWFRPSPSKKIKFKEVAHSLLILTGRIPPPSGWGNT